MAEAPFDLAGAHRWFAVELNNEAWDLLEKQDRTPEEDDRMIHAAHAACYHWLHAGAALNQLRAHCLLATVYAGLGHSEAAIRHAEQCLQLSETHREGQTLFDAASAAGCAHCAYRSAGRMESAAEMRERTEQAMARINDVADIAVIERLFLRP